MAIVSGRLKELTNANKFAKIQVARGAGIPYITYRRYESGEREPPASNIISLAKFFHVSTDYLLGLTDEPRIPDAETWALIKQIEAYRAQGKEHKEN